MQPVGMLLLRLGKWRYFLTGLAICVFAGLLCRAAGKLLGLFGVWQRFRGTCTAVHENGAVTVTFTDRHQIPAQAVLFPAKEDIVQTGDTVLFAVRTDLFCAGTYPQTPEAAAEIPDAILPAAVQRTRTLRAFFRLLLIQLAVCGIAFAGLMLTVKLCFPA